MLNFEQQVLKLEHPRRRAVANASKERIPPGLTARAIILPETHGFL
jgi:hypothetical protein